MAVYLIGFTVSLILIAMTEKKKTGIFIAASAIALLIPCLIAGLRAQTIGTDVMVYVKPLTQAAIMADDLKGFFNTYWFASWRNLYAMDYDIGFSLLVYVVAQLTDSLGAVLFTIQAFMILPIYMALARTRKQFPVWLGMLVYYFLSYNSTLNLMRQWVAMGFLLLAFQLLTEKKLWRTLLLTAVACLFHSTAVVALPLYLIYWVLKRLRGKQLVHNNFQIGAPMVVVIGLNVVAAAALFCLPLIVKVLSAIGLEKFNSYLVGNELRLMVNQIILRVPFFLLLVLNWKDMNRQSDLAPFFMCMLLFDTVAAQLLSIDEMAFRIGCYFSLYSILWLPRVCVCSRQPLVRKLSTVFLVVYCVFYWYYNYIYSMRHGTYPYVFAPFLSM